MLFFLNIVYDLSILSFKLNLIKLFLFWYKEIALFFLFIFRINYKKFLELGIFYFSQFLSDDTLNKSKEFLKFSYNNLFW